ncbi:aminopeptidase N [Rhodothalassium salexigens DSM 2132]|uniref:Aminopeptidase N n=1 Tax=Rhodothalassium salexigens DSM 2132 TaxID=1188247 RepID=A0A4R2PCY4_RHOSA|nr:aminopeptidase N [Rhodothalassium salexigens]MBB4212155.1 aminopeptidase N [Rhodothalassium salexigens DSM 2132]MBK1638177.1 aminopeptidase N [Rhodothalassium salexigens DSM 2132]TCP33029.1 aminopeptidase N [Rhodothalassium salexigens DSM 2132]
MDARTGADSPATPAESKAPQAINLADYRPPAFQVDQVDLTVDLADRDTRVVARLTVRRARAGATDLTLDGDPAMRLDGVTIDGEPVAETRLTRVAEQLTIADVPERFVLETVTRIDPVDNTRLEGLYKSGGIFCTQCEAEGFRNITFFPDRPDVMARYRVRIEADASAYPVLLSNGNRVEAGTLDGGRHFAVWEDPFPKPSYLFALVAGDLGRLGDSFTTRLGRPVTLNIWAARADLDKCGHAMASLKRAMAWDEQVYGLEYDLDEYNIVAVGDFNMGAMENKSLNVFNTKYVLASPETATDDDYDHIEGVIAHEYFHNWTGNRVTCRDWFQLSLKEGLTVFRDQQFSADMGSAALKRIDDVRVLRSHQFSEDAGPMAHPVRPSSYIEINNFYTTTVYNKGAEVIRMMHTLLGAEGFRRGIDLYFERHDGQAVTCDDFAAAMADAGGVDLGQFKLWYTQAGTPEVHAEGSYDPGAGRYTLTLTQRVPDTPGQTGKAPMHIPVKMALLGPNGQRLDARLAQGEGRADAEGFLLDLREASQQFVFEDVGVRPVASLLRDFSAPVRLTTDQSRDDKLFLLAHDDNAFARWEAGQDLAGDLILGLVADHAAGRALDVDPAFVQAIEQVIADAETDPALVAEIATLPSEVMLGQRMDEVDVDGLFAARQTVRETLGRALAARWQAVYDAASKRLAAGCDAADARQQRRVKNLALGYLGAAGAAGLRLAEAQYDAATTMTDRLAALRVLANADDPARERVLADFYARYEDQPLVIDKWFSIQAVSTRADTVERVAALMDHPAFTLANPNRVRSLVSAFSQLNQVRFHDASGQGYRLLADTVLKVDKLNPQIAARLVGPLGRWRRFDATRRSAMRSELERLVAVSDLSKDVYEIASKSLA